MPLRWVSRVGECGIGIAGFGWHVALVHFCPNVGMGYIYDWCLGASIVCIVFWDDLHAIAQLWLECAFEASCAEGQTR